jgi:hypothetical protein
MRRATAVLLSGALLAVGAPVGWYAMVDRGPEEFGGPAVQRLAEPAAEPAPALTPQRVGTTSARLADLALPVDPRADPPVEVRFAGQVVPVDRVGLDGQRRVVVPEDVRRSGWYEPGVAPGAETGSAVLVGHVDDREQGLGAFAEVRGLTAGDRITVRTASGRTLSFDVVSLEQFAKTEAPMTRLFSSTGPHRLVLISCAGAFDPATRSYADNVAVTAVPSR